MAFGKVTEETVYTCTGHPLKTDIANILDWMLNQDFTTAYKSILSSDIYTSQVTGAIPRQSALFLLHGSSLSEAVQCFPVHSR